MLEEQPDTTETAVPAEAASAEGTTAAPKKRAPRKTTKQAPARSTAEDVLADLDRLAAEKAKAEPAAKRTSRRKAVADDQLPDLLAEVAGLAPSAEPPSAASPDGEEPAPEPAPKRPARKRAPRKAAAESVSNQGTVFEDTLRAPADGGTGSASPEEAPAADAPVDVPAAEAPAAPAETRTEAPAAPAAEKPARRRVRPTAFNPFALPEELEAEEPEAAAEPVVVTRPFPPAGLLFQAPEPQLAERPAARFAADEDDEPAEDETDEIDAVDTDEADEAEESASGAEEPSDEESDDDRRPRRRRGGRGRRGKTRDEEDAEAETDAAESADAEPDDEDSADAAEEPRGDDEDDTQGSRRRRRRRRRSGEGESDDEESPNTTVRVREGRRGSGSGSDEVTGVKGSTRLEAKKQRRREGREAGRRRPVITEAEFLARREAVDRHMVVRQRGDRTQIAVLEDRIVVEHYLSENRQQASLIGNIYLGKVQNVLPSMEAAFVDIGRGRNAVLYAGEVNWDAMGMQGQPRRIELAMNPGDPVLVQVTKDPVGHKGARLTSQISLPGRFLVYVPGNSMTGISRKLPDNERARLKKILREVLPESAGVIVRTAAEGASETELTYDVNRLSKRWDQIEKKTKSTKIQAPELLYSEPDLTVRIIRDVFNEDFKHLTIDGDEAWDTIHEYVSAVAPDLVDRLQRWEGEKDIFAEHRVDEQIAKALDRKVNLPSGGSLVIDRTEAMTVVDVNTGKFTGSGGNLEETVTKNNLEAAEEVIRQLRLRDIGGIIVVDFIDMVLEANRDLVVRRLVECLGRDRTKHQVAEVTSLGLVQMTRKRIGTGLAESLAAAGEDFTGRGLMLPGTESSYVTSGGGQSTRKEGNGKRRNQRGSHEPVVEQVEFLPDDEESRERAEEAAKAAAVSREALAKIAAATKKLHEDEQHESGESSVPERPNTPPSNMSRAVAEPAGEEPEVSEHAVSEFVASEPAADEQPSTRSSRRSRGRSGGRSAARNGSAAEPDAVPVPETVADAAPEPVASPEPTESEPVAARTAEPAPSIAAEPGPLMLGVGAKPVVMVKEQARVARPARVAAEPAPAEDEAPAEPKKPALPPLMFGMKSD